MSIKRTRHTKDFKAKVALESLTTTGSLNKLASKYSLHPTQLSQWRQVVVKGAPGLFSTPRERKNKDEPSASDLYEEIGRLKMELEFLKKKFNPNS
jgi:transposase